MMPLPLAVVLESTVEENCPQVEVDELRESSEEIAQALRDLGYRTNIVPLTLDLETARRRLLADPPAIVFNLVDSIEGKGDLVPIAPMLLEHMNMPFTGAGSIAMTTSCHKIISKQMLHGAGLPVPDWLTEAEIESSSGAISEPYILKSITEHASFGIFADSIVSDMETLRARWRQRKSLHKREWFAERYIDGREFNISVLGTGEGPRVLPCAEIIFTGEFPKNAPRIVDYTAKWLYDSAECKGTVRRFDFSKSDNALLAELENISLRCWEVFGLFGYARVDFRIDGSGKPWILEVNSNPFLTANEGFGAAAARTGMDFPCIVGKILEDGYLRAQQPAPEMEDA